MAINIPTGKYLLIALGTCGLCAFDGYSSETERLHFTGTKVDVISIRPEASTGLETVYVLDDASGAVVSYEFSGYKRPEFYRFSTLGAAYSEPLKNVDINGSVCSFRLQGGDMGYAVKDGDRTYYFWIIDYKLHRFTIDSISFSPESGCESTIVDFSGQADDICYYSINGRRHTLSRDIRVEYNNLKWDDASGQFLLTSEEDIVPSISGSIALIPPVYSATRLTVDGDRFLRAWGTPVSKTTGVYQPVSVTVSANATPSREDEADNVLPSDVVAMGGSAPYTVGFSAYVSDAVMHCEWQISGDENFDNINYRFNQQDFDFTFTEEGVYYIRFVGSNSDGSCEAYSDTYTVSIGASELLIPNAFSPDGDGVNDEWKVAYRSLIDFECWIFDRQGHQLHYFNDPSKGWDGKHKGKTVGAGVYYYVINATGSDGRRYKRSGDINIIRYRGGSSSVSPSE